MTTSDYQRVERAIRYLKEHFREQPSLDDVAASAGLSAFHFQRMFRRWAGISPKRFLQFLTAGHAERLLRDGHSTFDASLAAGLSGSGRLHDLFVTVHGVTPGEVKRQGAELEIRYGVHAGPFGYFLLAVTSRGVCGLNFMEDRDAEPALQEMAERWPRAQIRNAPRHTRAVADRIFDRRRRKPLPLDLWVPGSNFQIKVWEALLRIPPGTVTTYGQLAAAIDMPRAARAVGTAVGQNPVAYLIPCHRVIRANGSFGEYHWGTERKQALLAWEAAHTSTE